METTTSTSKANKTFLAQAFQTLWDSGGVLVAIDATHPDVLLPADVKSVGDVVLDYDPFAIVPIQGLRIANDGVYADLSFNRSTHKTFVPWNAFLAMQNRQARERPPEPPKKRPSHLKAV
jgi:hypothetical protein